MYLHLGYSTVLPFEEIIGVFDLDSVSASRRTQEFLERAEDHGELTDIGRGLPASLVVSDWASYLSPVRSATLARRMAEDRWE